MKHLFILFASCLLVVSAQNRDGMPVGALAPGEAPPMIPPSSSTSPSSNPPNIMAIFSACSSDVLSLCQSTGTEICLHNLHLNIASLSTECRDTLVRELPCAEDVAAHCSSSISGPSVMSCLEQLSQSTLSPRCVSWLEARRNQFFPQPEGPAILPHPAVDPVYPEEPQDDEDDEDDENMGHHGHGRHHRWGKKRGHFFIMIALVALLAGSVGACCALCCARRRFRCCRRGGAGCCQRQPAAAPVAIPLEQVPRQGGVHYAVMADEVHSV